MLFTSGTLFTLYGGVNVKLVYGAVKVSLMAGLWPLYPINNIKDKNSRVYNQL